MTEGTAKGDHTQQGSENQGMARPPGCDTCSELSVHSGRCPWSRIFLSCELMTQCPKMVSFLSLPARTPSRVLLYKARSHACASIAGSAFFPLILPTSAQWPPCMPSWTAKSATSHLPLCFARTRFDHFDRSILIAFRNEAGVLHQLIAI